MITRLTIDDVACYKKPAVLETDKRVNLVYGLNGAGKSTISDYLHNPSDLRFGKCSHDCASDLEIVVYNQSFVQETFYESGDLPGIFTLSKENKEARVAVDAATRELGELRTQLDLKNELLEDAEIALETKVNEARNKVWEIKQDYSGGGRILDFCLDGLKKSIEKLFLHLRSLSKPPQKPKRTIAELQVELTQVLSEAASRLDKLPKILLAESAIETDTLFGEPIIGSSDSTVAALIEKLGNSDWVNQGLSYLSYELGGRNQACPFCQEPTISKAYIDTLKEYFDDTFEKQLAKLRTHAKNYRASAAELAEIDIYAASPCMAPTIDVFRARYDELRSTFAANAKLIDEKLAKPSTSVALTDTGKKILELNTLIDDANRRVDEHNQKIDNVEDVKQSARKEFWQIMRWEYDYVLQRYESDKATCETKVLAAHQAVTSVEEQIAKVTKLIAEKQKATVNIDTAVNQINGALSDLGMHDFSIAKKPGSTDLYTLMRTGQRSGVFTTLSEGEKMMISFLYFLEYCRGKSSATAPPTKKIVVIDDPISSLSHIFVFNIGRLIQSEFLRSNKYEQVIVLTHSLYFFYELVETKKDRRDENQKLFRLVKTADGTRILEMTYDEIQNDYQTYWTVIKDPNNAPALIANCMRNVIEHFFGFVEKRDLNNVFQKPELEQIRFQAFNRYINRESHSDAHNIFDQKDFDYNDFREAFRLVFELNNYQEHYQRMIN